MEAHWKLVGLAAALLALVPVALIFLRRPRAPVAQLEIRAGEPFTLRASAAGRLRLWLRYDVAYGPTEDVWALDGELAVTVGAAPAWRDAVHVRFNDDATAQPKRFGESGSFYGLSSWKGAEDRGTAAATVFLGAVEVPAGASVEVTGALHAAAGTEARALVLYLSP